MKRLPYRYYIDITRDAHRDIVTRSRFIFKAYGYSSIVEGFEKRVYKAIKSLEYFPGAYISLDRQYQGNAVYYKAISKNIIVYTVDHYKRIVYVLRVLNESSLWQDVIRHYLKD